MRATHHRCVEAILACVATTLFAMTQPRGEAFADPDAGSGSTAPDAITYTLDAHVVATGSAQRASNACFRMTSTIAEPAPGYSWSAHYALTGGFAASRARASGDDIFFNGFEDCSS